jgi:hypothetical protein
MDAPNNSAADPIGELPPDEALDLACTELLYLMGEVKSYHAGNTTLMALLMHWVNGTPWARDATLRVLEVAGMARSDGSLDWRAIRRRMWLPKSVGEASLSIVKMPGARTWILDGARARMGAWSAADLQRPGHRAQPTKARCRRAARPG